MIVAKILIKLGKITFLVFLIAQIVLLSSNILLKNKTENNLVTDSKTLEQQLQDISILNNNLNIKSIPDYKISKVKTALPKPSESVEVWQKEIFTIEDTRNRQYGDGPLYNQLVEKKYTSDPIKILILGDNFTTGANKYLSENSYPNILESELNNKYPGLYKVTVLGDNMSSFLRQSDLLTKKKMHKLEPDVVILTYTAGRLEPNYYENKYCREFNTCLKENESGKIETALGYDYNKSNPKWRIIMCLKSENNLISTLFRKVLYPYYSNLAEFLALKYCNFEKIKAGFDIPTNRDANLYSEPESSPYYNDFIQYLNSTSSVIDEYNKERNESGKRLASKYMINLSWRTEHLYPELSYKGRKFKSISGPLITKYNDYGYTEIPTLNSREIIGKTKTWEVGNIQGRDGSDNGDCYYNCKISQSQMRKNISNYLAGVIDHPLKFQPGILFQNAHAQDIKEIINKNHPAISISNPENTDILDDYGPWYISYKQIDANNFGYGYSDSVAAMIKNKSKKTYETLKNTYCARIGHPYTLFSLNNSFFNKNDSIKIGYIEGGIENLMVVIERKKTNNERFLSDAYLIKNKEAIVLKFDKEITSIYLGDISKSCTEKDSQLLPFKISLGRF